MKIIKGFYWHVHHDLLLEYCYAYNERVAFIKNNKPAHEIDERLRVMQPVKGKLPDAIIKAGQAYAEARQAYDKARQAYAEAWQACAEAWQAYAEAWQAYAEAIKDNHEIIEKLHAEECKDCTWDGEKLVINP